jgi:gamma-glutamylcyclotransferase (GGCT)/AIG2-like uncharacterized protein YtfP
MGDMVRIFVYGTLRKGEFRNYILGDSRFIGHAKAKGVCLYDLGEFPVLIKGDGEVMGEVYEIPMGLLEKLDWIEGVPDLFRRELREVKLENGKTVDAYVYVFNRNKLLNLQRKVVYLFEYGTMRKGERRHEYIENYRFVGNAKGKGFLLYKIGNYPWMVKGKGEVIGEVYEIPEDWISNFDWLEGVPNSSKRELIKVELENGEIVPAYAYLLKPSLKKIKKKRKVTLIPSGDWKDVRSRKNKKIK